MKIKVEHEELDRLFLWTAYSLVGDQKEINQNLKSLTFKDKDLVINMISKQFDNAHKIINFVNLNQYQLLGSEHFSKISDQERYYTFYNKQIKMLLIQLLVDSGLKQMPVISNEDNKIVLKILDPFNSNLRCCKCGFSKWDSLTFENNQILCEPSNQDISYNKETNKIERVLKPIKKCAIKFDQENLESIIKINKGLSFVNFFDEEILGKKEHTEDFDINYLSGQYNVFLEYAKNNVGYFQTGNTSVLIYKHKTKDSILIFDSIFEYLDESSEISDEDKRFYKNLAKDYENIGSISCEMWRVMFSDINLTKLKQHKNDEHQEPVEVKLSKGKYKVSCSINRTEVFYGRIDKID